MSESVLVTGGSGTFGQAFTKTALERDWVSKLVIFSRDELKQSEMQKQFPDSRMRFLIGDVRDPERLQLALRGIDTVIHAAALKQVPACEQHPWEAVQTNVVGTWNVAHAAITAGVSCGVFLSTDKAPDATTLYGATKFAAERLWLRSNVYAAGTNTKLVATRYGNVLGSRGSVVEVWRDQPTITVTDPSATRFWMTIQQAVDLVWWARQQLRRGEIAVPKIGASTLATLAEAVNPTATQTLGTLRGTEKRHETLLTSWEAPRSVERGDHYVIQPADRSWGESVPDRGGALPAGFAFTSDTAPQLTADDLRGMLHGL